MLFANTDSISQKYRLTAKAGEDLSAYSTGDMDPKIVVLNNRMKGLATQRQKKGRFLKLASWALYHRSTLKEFAHWGATNLTANLPVQQSYSPFPFLLPLSVT
jgi:uncharacterized small protein (DUF1192 family)